MSMPDIIGLPLNEARHILEKSMQVIETITLLSPPREKTIEYDDSYRVIRVIHKDTDTLELQICKPL